MNYQNILFEIEDEIQQFYDEGKVANYIPILKNINPKQFAMTILLCNGDSYSVGNVDTKFSIQSISKVFTFSLALKLYGKQLYKHVGHEPSGDPFNSLIQLEYENGKPRNPFINAGALVVTDLLIQEYKDKTFDKILDFIKELSNDINISYDKEVALCESQTGYMNFALINMMKAYNNISNDIQEVTNTYFKHCSISMSSKQLCKAMLFLANNGVDPIAQKEFLNIPKTKRVNSLMLTCGHYDASGDFAFKVGLPGKSGVGGGIVAVIPQKMSICVYSPQLNSNGNSLIGTKALELFTTKTGLSIF